MAYCENCGKQLEESVKFCTSCGASYPTNDDVHNYTDNN